VIVGIIKSLFILLVGAALATFLWSNYDDKVTVYFTKQFRTVELPLAAALMAALLTGFLLAAALSLPNQFRLRARIRELTRKLDRLEDENAELGSFLDDSDPESPPRFASPAMESSRSGATRSSGNQASGSLKPASAGFEHEPPGRDSPSSPSRSRRGRPRTVLDGDPKHAGRRPMPGARPPSTTSSVSTSSPPVKSIGRGELTKSRPREHRGHEIHSYPGTSCEKGQLERAVQIHQSVLHRPGLPLEREGARSPLPRDGLQEGRVPLSSDGYLPRSGGAEPKNAYALTNLVKIHEEEQEWEKALLQEELAKVTGTEDSTLRAFLYDQIGQAAAGAGDEPKAVRAFEESTRSAPQVPAAYLHHGDLLEERGRPEEAEAQWSRLARESPPAKPFK
jgi:uncharacterized integral membrane protein